MNRHDTPETDYHLERLVFLSDGVFAIVITLLALELRPPPNWDRTLAGLLAGTGPALLAFAISFAAVGAFCNAHRLIFARVQRSRRRWCRSTSCCSAQWCCCRSPRA